MSHTREARDLPLDKCRGALVGVVVGDSLGAPFEGASGPLSIDTLAEVEHRDSQLTYTDDTALTLALAEAIVGHGTFSQEHVADHFAQTFAAEPWRGYGAGTVRTLRRISAGDPWEQAALELFDGGGSYGNGAAMRVAPIAVLAAPDLDAVERLARRSAEITHRHPLGIEGAAMQALAVARALARGPGSPVDGAAWIASLRSRCRQSDLVEILGLVPSLLSDPQPADVVERLGNTSAAVASVPAALTAYLAHPDDFAAAVRFALRLGGDTDTIAAMTGALAGASLGLGAIPEAWQQRVEGVALLRELADRLVALRVT